MSEPMLPRAASRPRLPSSRGHGSGAGAVRRCHELAAAAALVTTQGSGMVVVKRMGSKTPGKSAARVAKAWNRMVSRAEARHESYWASHDRRTLGREHEAKYESQRAVVRVLDTRAAIGMAILKSQGRAGA